MNPMVRLTDKHKKRLKFFLIKLPIILVVFVFVMIGALKLVERYPDPLREGFEKYLSEQTRTQVTIGQVDKVAFHPNIDIQLQKITLHRANNAAIIEGEAEKFALSVPLAGLFIKKGRINFLEIRNLKANKNIFTAFDIDIKTAQIIDDEADSTKANFTAQGIYGGKEFDIDVEIQKDKKSYIVPKKLLISVNLGAYKIEASLQKSLLDVVLMGVIFQKGSEVAPKKDYPFLDGQAYAMDNPLACLYQYAGGDLAQCNKYLKGNE